MPERAADVHYTPYATEQSSGSLGGGFSQHATPNDFGAQLSGQLQDTGKDFFDIVQKQQGMINETAMTNADANFATKVGDIKGKYTSLTGMAAYNAFPQYQNDIKQAFQESRADLPPMAQHGFDMTATRTMANHVADGSSYASSQLKEANRDSYSSQANSQLQSLLDPDTAMDKNRSQYHLDSLKYAAQAQVDPDHPGLQTDPTTGSVSFSNTPEGTQGKADLQRNMDAYLTQGYVNRYNTLAKLNVGGAYDEYQQERSSMPRGAQVTLDATFAPKIMDMHTQNASGMALNDADQAHWKALTNPSSVGSNSYNLGNVKTPSGAANNTQQFVQPATPVDGVVLTANNLRGKLYEGKTLEQIGHTWTSTDPDAWVKNVSTASGVSPDTVPNLNDPQQLGAILKGIATAEKSPKDRALFTDDIINRGVQSSLSGKQANTSAAPTKTYGTNDNGAPLSKADYYTLHKQDILANGDAYAEQQMPGDLALKRAVRQTLENSMNSTIANQHLQYTQDSRNVMRGITGELTKGQIPATEAELRAVPGMAPLLDKIAYQDPKFSETIPTLVAKASSRNTTTNSPNGYSTILRTLEPNDPTQNPNRIDSVDHLDKLLGRSDSTGINMKDYNDAKPVIEASQPWKDFLSKNMQDMAQANGNIDGKGQDRALLWYNQVMAEYKANGAKGDKKMSDPEFIKHINDEMQPPSISTMQQITNWASSLTKGKQEQVPTFSDPNDPAFAKLPPGSQFQTPDGQIRTKK